MKFREITSAFLLVCSPLSPAAERPNLVVILSDDHRYDFMGFMEKAPEFLETPNLDRMAQEGAHLQNAFVSTSLCSPSRASILTGQYMHRHRVVDNQRAVGLASASLFFEHVEQTGQLSVEFRLVIDKALGFYFLAHGIR